MFKKKAIIVIDHALAAAKENYAKAVADYNTRAKQAYDALERKEYYFIEDKDTYWVVYHRVFRQRRLYESLYFSAQNYEDATSSLSQYSITPRSEYKQIGLAHDTLQLAEDALDRRIDPNKYRTFYEATPPLRKFEK